MFLQVNRIIIKKDIINNTISKYSKNNVTVICLVD